MPFRVYHLPINFEVQPLLKFNVSTRSSFSRIDEHVLIVQIHNLKQHWRTLSAREALKLALGPSYVNIQSVTVKCGNWIVKPMR